MSKLRDIKVSRSRSHSAVRGEVPHVLHVGYSDLIFNVQSGDREGHSYQAETKLTKSHGKV